MAPTAFYAQSFSVDFEMSSAEVMPIWENWSSCGHTTTDATLTQILQNHGAEYCSASRQSYPSLAYVNGGIATCSDCDPNQLVADLLAYNTLITKARVSPMQSTFASVLNITPDTYPAVTGADAANLIVTDNTALNLIYQQHKVFIQNPVGTFWIELQCDCSVNDLRDDLIAGGFITGDDDYFYQNVGILATTETLLPVTSVYPNPFRDRIDIQTNTDISGYALYDLTGKKLIETQSKEVFDGQTSALAPGIFFLTLQLGNGTSSNHKIVKQ